MIIREFAIENFRSLKRVRIPTINKITILHGDNDVGKSNILTALEIIFKPKQHDTIIASPLGQKVQKRVLGFWEGPLPDFTDNYYMDSSEPIKFHVTVRFSPGELREIVGEEARTLPIFRGGRNPDDLKILGEISRNEPPMAYQKLVNVILNNVIMYEKNSEGESIYFSKIEDFSENIKYTIFERIMSTLNGLFTLVSSRRYITNEVDMKGEKCELSPTYFKNWLFNLQMNRETYSEYEEIKKLFSEPPFNFGDMSFAREKENIEIFIKRNELRLPIGRLGTGVQQILYLLANVVHNKGKVVGLEEMEINLSERSQNYLLQILDNLVSSEKSTIRQVIMSSHSYDYGKKGQVLRWWVSHNGKETSIKKWDNEGEAFLMSMRIGRLTERLSDKELKDVFIKTSTTSDLKSLIKRIFTKEEISEILKD
jgi:hypothetical protein